MAEELTNAVDSFVFKADRPWPNRRLKVAAIVGHTTPDSVRLWVRTARPGAFSILVYRRETEGDPSREDDGRLREALSATPLLPDDIESLADLVRQEDFENEDYDADTTRVLDLGDLEPDTRYG